MDSSILLWLVAILTSVVGFMKWCHSYWKRKGLYQIEPEFLFGNTKKLFTKKQIMAEQFQDIYNHFRAKGLKHGGGYLFLTPFYMPVTPDLLKNILLKDFDHFMNHGGYVNPRADPLSGHLFALEDSSWRKLRTKLTPTFTSSKMKMMFQTFVDCTDGLVDLIESFREKGEPVDTKEILGRFTTDIIGSCAFGLECNSLKNPDADFRKYGRKFFEPEFLRLFALFAIPPSVLTFIGFKGTPSDVEKFFMNVIKDTVNYRENNKIFRKDFLQLLIQMKNGQSLNKEQENVSNDNDIKVKTNQDTLTMNELAAQCFVFFLGGFETSSTLMTFALYELSKNPHIQDKLRDEINTVLKKHDGKLTYDAVVEMTYLEKVLLESLRKYPPAGLLARICTKRYKIPDTDIVLEKGTKVQISVFGLHRDPEYYPDPEVFDPERFSEENKSKRPDFTFMPFGEGPRICIGLRFGMLQSKIGIITFLRNFKVTLNKKTRDPIVFEKSLTPVTTAEGGVWVDCERIK